MGGGLGGMPALNPGPEASKSAAPTDPATAPAATTPPAVAAAVPSSSFPPSPGVDAQVQQRVRAVAAKFKSGDPDLGVTQNQMKLLGLAFHNTHDTFGGFPSISGFADKNMPTKHGLSWRVALLPYMEEAALYQQFHLDEPWDSPHNLTLVTRMPKCFGENAEGKTRVHVLTGNGAPFKQDELLKMSEVTDGSSNTILAFVGGPDTAEIWTKPVGRQFDPKDPLKSLGNVSSKFWITLMDGSVRRLSKSMPADTFAKLVQHSDGQVLGDFGEESGSQPGQPTAGLKINAPVTPLAPATPKLALNSIPDDAFVAVAVHPRRIVNHPVVKALYEQFSKVSGASIKDELPRDAQRSLENVEMLRVEFGVALENLDQVILVLDKSLPDAMMANPFAPPPFGVIAKNSAPLDVDGILARLTRDPEGMALVEHEGVAIVLSPRMEDRRPQGPPGTGPAAVERMSVAFLSDSTVLFGAESVVRKMISARASTTAKSGLTQQLDAMGNPLVVVAVNGAPVEKSVKAILKNAPVPFALFAPYIAGAQTVNLAWDLDAKDMLNLSLKFKTPELAQGLFGMLDQQFKAAKEQYTGLRQMAAQDPTSQTLLPYSDQLVEEIKLTNTAETIVLTVPQVKNLDKLAQALQPALAKAKEAAESAERKNNLKQIGLAFHNYHDSMGHFPAYNGKGGKTDTSRGLSWRVYLLPYVDGGFLYTQFKLDEPWDSPHNLALVKQMPKVYGKNAEGKTTIHVFRGKGTPFATDDGLGMVNITDGTSNTLLAVEAGDSTAEIWTKPGGLEFKPADPWKCLGGIKEFQALFMDGSVRKLQDVDKATLSKLIQHADGKPVQIP